MPRVKQVNIEQFIGRKLVAVYYAEGRIVFDFSREGTGLGENRIEIPYDDMGIGVDDVNHGLIFVEIPDCEKKLYCHYKTGSFDILKPGDGIEIKERIET